MNERCALCGTELNETEYNLRVHVMVDGMETEPPLATTRRICETCAAPAGVAALHTTLRRLPSILPGAY